MCVPGRCLTLPSRAAHITGFPSGGHLSRLWTFLQVLVNHRQKSIAVFIQLALPYTGNAAKLHQVLGQFGAHFLQRAVVKNDVGWYALFVGQLSPAFPQGIPDYICLSTFMGANSRIGLSVNG
jgi:hypothetical protein